MTCSSYCSQYSKFVLFTMSMLRNIVDINMKLTIPNGCPNYVSFKFSSYNISIINPYIVNIFCPENGVCLLHLLPVFKCTLEHFEVRSKHYES